LPCRLLRRRLSIPRAVTAASVAAGPLALAVLKTRTKQRDALVYALQMWGFLHAKDLAYDDPTPCAAAAGALPDRRRPAVGAGELPTVRLQRRLASRGGSRTSTAL